MNHRKQEGGQFSEGYILLINKLFLLNLSMSINIFYAHFYFHNVNYHQTISWTTLINPFMALNSRGGNSMIGKRITCLLCMTLKLQKKVPFICTSFCLVCLMVFNTTFDNISVTLWRSVLLVKETGGPGENQQPVTSHWQTLLYNVSVLARISKGQGATFEKGTFMRKRWLKKGTLMCKDWLEKGTSLQ